MKRRTPVLLLLCAIMLLSAVTPQNSAVATDKPERPFSPNLQSFEIGVFSYRTSFTLGDGTEILLIRGTYRATYLYQHHQPTVSEHYLSAFVGFYFGKTMLGRPVVQSISVDYVAYYPYWIDSAGYTHDALEDGTGFNLFMLNNSIRDGQLAYGMALVDNKPLSRYIPEFGGTIVLSGLVVTLDGGVELTFSDDIEIKMSKHNNDLTPNDGELNGVTDLEYESDAYLLTVDVGSSAPLIVILDLILGIVLISTAVVLVSLAVLHIKGRIKLPLDKLKRAPAPQEQ